MRIPLQLPLAVAIVVTVCVAADPPPKRYDAAGNELTVYELEVSPAPEPPLAMKYRLLPDPAELKPGNAATQYYKAMVFEGQDPVSTDTHTKLFDWHDGETNVEVTELRDALNRLDTGELYKSFRTATYLADCDWGLNTRVEGLSLPLPEINQLRGVAIIPAMKAKLHIADGQLDEAMALARDLFTLSKRMQEGELMVQALVGIAISGTLRTTFFHDWISTPDSPNLYWTLATIPLYFDSTRIVGTEFKMPEFTLHKLSNLETDVLGVDEANNLAYQAWHIDHFYDQRANVDVKGRQQLLVWTSRVYGEARRELEQRGYSKERIDVMPVSQVALLSRWLRYQELRDDIQRRVLLAYVQQDGQAFDKIYESARAKYEHLAPFDKVIPPFKGLASAQQRQARWLAAIATIEALRMYAADKGAWPAKLEDITQVPLPKNPDNNKPFAYKLDGKVAVLTVPYATGLTNEYRLKLRKK
jgi:hypothetical protein